MAEHLKGEKIRVFKYRPKKRYRKRAGPQVAADPPGDQGHKGPAQTGRVRHKASEKKKEEAMAHKKGLGSSRNGRDSQSSASA